MHGQRGNKNEKQLERDKDRSKAKECHPRLGKYQDVIENAWGRYGEERIYCSCSTLHIKQGQNGEILTISKDE